MMALGRVQSRRAHQMAPHHLYLLARVLHRLIPPHLRHHSRNAIEDHLHNVGQEIFQLLQTDPALCLNHQKCLRILV